MDWVCVLAFSEHCTLLAYHDVFEMEEKVFNLLVDMKSLTEESGMPAQLNDNGNVLQ